MALPRFPHEREEAILSGVTRRTPLLTCPNKKHSNEKRWDDVVATLLTFVVPQVYSHEQGRQ